MGERVWTQPQKDAIYARGGSLLLSAAAGSGKTAVLVERIVQLLTDEKDPTEPGELLVVTFTKAAAAEMRGRINEAINELMEKEPENNFYRNIKMKLPDAQISTIDSFCIKLVRENFHAADISPDFKMLDDSQQRILRADAMTKTLDDLCHNDPDMYDMLNSVTSYVRDDSNLSAKVLKLYNFSLSHPFPNKWLRDTENMYNDTENIKNSLWGKTIIDNYKLTLEYCIGLLESGINILPKCPEVDSIYSYDFENVINHMNRLLNILDQGSWDEIYSAVNGFTMPALGRAPRGYGENVVKKCAKAKYDKVKALTESGKKTFCATTRENSEDLEKLRPVIHGLMGIVRDFSKNYDELKAEEGGYNFSDIMHKALDLLAEEKDGNIERTPLARTLSETYREILIDEYQDTNEAQDMLFNLISKNGENIFMVGDVKQSVYKFRLAMPEIFVKKSKEYADFDNKTYPAKIILGTNFRSRKGVLDNINYLFENIMSEDAGDMEYTDKEALHYGNVYNEDKSPGLELHFVESEEKNDSAIYVGELIKKMIADGVTVSDRGGERPATYGDFCILLRSVKSRGDVYEKTLSHMGIPVFGEKKAGLFDTTEIRVFMSLLKSIDNPGDDVSLLALMFSPIYGFTADEIAELKIPNKKRNLYACLTSSNTEKAHRLLTDLTTYRQMSAVMPLDNFIRTLLDLTGYDSIVGAMNNGEVRRNNLLFLCELASDYTDNGENSLGGFIRYINRIVNSGGEIPAAATGSADADVVRIYSIHKSKGLEFPFVIIGDCERKFNEQDIREDMIISPSAGVGMVILDNDNLKKYSTLCHAAAKIEIKKSTKSEELRILYVAMTRAKERLICVSEVKDAAATLQKNSADITGMSRPHPCAVLGSVNIMQLLIMGYATHPDMAPLIKDSDLEGLVVRDFKHSDSRLLALVGAAEEHEEEAENEDIVPSDANLVAEMRRRIEYEYPYKMPADARPKRIASDFENRDFVEAYFALEKPSFLLDGKLTPAQVGTANHLFFQCCDFNNDDVESECERLKNAGILTEAQANAIRIDKVKKFRSSDIFKRIMSSDEVYREKEFTVQLPLKEIAPEANENVGDEKVLILGIADIVFVEDGYAVVVDYKTDRSKTPEEFVAAYSGQLRMYKLAMEQILDIPVKETLIYSLELERTIFSAEPKKIRN